MQVTVTGRNIDLTPALKSYVNDKLQRAQKHFEADLQIKALLTVSRNPSVAKSQTAEVTVQVNGQVIRGAESTENMYASIDFVADKIERQLRKYKTRYTHKTTNKARERGLQVVTEEELDSEPEYEFTATMVAEAPIESAPVTRIVRSKKYALKPMPPDEACKHMDLLGHDFFMFINIETKQVSTVYHRRDGNYGLIEPEY